MKEELLPPQEWSYYCISPIDGRYYKIVEPLRHYFSEFALMKFRTFVELNYLISLIEFLDANKLLSLDKNKWLAEKQMILDIYENFSHDSMVKIKAIEAKINHDVKAVEIFIGEELKRKNLNAYIPYIHLGLTSQDVTDTSFALILHKANKEIILPLISNIIEALNEKVALWGDILILGHTHGQPATPTPFNKELLGYIERLQYVLAHLNSHTFTTKFGGATGYMNAHYIFYPNLPWENFASNFINSLNLTREKFTKQTSHYDSIISYLQQIKHINLIVLEIAQDMWLYAMKDYITFETRKEEVGSSTMPHKINPIDYENSEGNVKIANALLDAISNYIGYTRLQRDLSSSTIIRNIGTAIAHSILAWKRAIEALRKTKLNTFAIQKDLESHYEILAEVIQILLRKHNCPDAYQKVKNIFMGRKGLTKEEFNNIVATLDLPPEIKKQIMSLTPSSYGRCSAI